MIVPEARQITYRKLGGYLALSIAILAFMWFFGDFLLQEPDFYPNWDPRNWYRLAGLARALLSGEPTSWAPFRATLQSEYNALFALPLAPALMVFDQSYYVYGMAVAVIYGTAASLAVGAVTVVVLAGYRASVIYWTFSAAALVTATRSAVWWNVIWYYPDVGDAFVLAVWVIAAILLLRHPTWLLTAGLVVLTVVVLVFRRHLVFAWAVAGIGLFIAAVIECWVDWKTNDQPVRREHLRSGARRIGALAASAIFGLGIMLALVPQFVRGMASIIVHHAYVEFEQTPTDVAVAMFGVMGVIPMVLSAAGYIASAIVFRRPRFEIIGLGLGAALYIVLWVALIRQVGPQGWIVPGAFFLPIGIGLGVGTLAERFGGRIQLAALGTAFLLLFVSAGRLVDGATSKIMDIGNPPLPPLLQGRVAKLWLHHGMEGPFKEVFAHLEIEGPLPRTVLVDASSAIFNQAALQSAAEALLGDLAKSYFVEAVPDLDARDKLPVSEIMDADFVLVTDPLQTLFPTGFNGLAAVRDMFSEHRLAALDFELVEEPVAFPGSSLSGAPYKTPDRTSPFRVSIYKRVREGDDRTALATIEALRSAVPSRGYGQPSWIEIGRPRRGEPFKARGKGDVLAYNRIKGDGWPARYMSYDEPPVGLTELGGVGRTSCPRGTLLTLHVVESDGTRHKALATAFLAQGDVEQSFSLATAVPALGSRLELEIDPPLANIPCDVRLTFSPGTLW
jgi:hypothetical protein